MRSRAMFAGVVLGCALVSGGWLVKRGLAGATTPRAADNARVFEQVYRHIQRDFVDTLADSAIIVRAVDGLVSELHDPHSAYLSPDVLARLSERTTGRYAGVGAQIDLRDGWIIVVSPLPGGPALDAGIQIGDRFAKVDGKPWHDFTIEETQKALRGPPGTTVHVTMERPGLATPLDFTLTRREIRIRSVQNASMLKDSVGYVALTIFSEESAADLRKAIDSLQAAGMKSLIFDLRADPGGLLDQGVAVADLFLDPGQKIVGMSGRTADASRSYSDRQAQRWPQLPIAVLVDSNSASASEIVAGALQDHDRALILGTASYGKGSAQNVFPLVNGGAVKLTTALWFTPSGRTINRKRAEPGDPPDTTKRPQFKTDAGRVVLGGGGITPDVVLASPTASAADSAFGRAVGKHVQEFLAVLTDYALSLKVSHRITSPDFTVTPEMRAEFLRRLQARGVSVDSATYVAATSLIDRRLGDEITRYVFGTEAQSARRLRNDPAVVSTLRLLTGATTPKALFERASSK